MDLACVVIDVLITFDVVSVIACAAAALAGSLYWRIAAHLYVFFVAAKRYVNSQRTEQSRCSQ